MSTNKTMKNSKARSPKPTPSRPRAKGALRATGGKDAKRFAMPAAALLGTGALAAAGFLMREELAELMHMAVDGVLMTRRLTFPKLLAFGGLQRRRSILSAAVPELGGLALGLLSGAALALWLSPEGKGTLDSKIVIPAGSGVPAPREPALASVPLANAHRVSP